MAADVVRQPIATDFPTLQRRALRGQYAGDVLAGLQATLRRLEAKRRAGQVVREVDVKAALLFVGDYVALCALHLPVGRDQFLQPIDKALSKATGTEAVRP